jgi:hypothetical protein
MNTPHIPTNSPGRPRRRRWNWPWIIASATLLFVAGMAIWIFYNSFINPQETCDDWPAELIASVQEDREMSEVCKEQMREDWNEVNGSN